MCACMYVCRAARTAFSVCASRSAKQQKSMYVCIHICMYIYIYIYVCMYIYIYIYVNWESVSMYNSGRPLVDFMCSLVPLCL